jgi:hypothetical protein
MSLVQANLFQGWPVPAVLSWLASCVTQSRNSPPQVTDAAYYKLLVTIYYKKK